jgi:uncharacterized protein (DUF58 family)
MRKLWNSKASPNKEQSFFGLLAGADATYSKIPQRMRLQIDKISQGLSEYGPRKLRRRGPGTEFFESRDFRPDSDDPRRINARLSARAGKPVVIEKEAEIRQHFYLWRDSSGSMEYASQKDGYSKKQASEIMLLAFARHLARNEELIGILDRKGAYRGGKAQESVARKLLDVTIIAGDMPFPARKLPRHSTAVLFSDFLMDKEALVKGLDQLSGVGLKGFMVMVLDPEELDFNFKGHVEFEGLEGEGREKFKKAEAMKAAYQAKIKAHIDDVKGLCEAKGFRFILQRTDEPLHKGLLAIYGLSPDKPAHSPAPGL